MIDIPISRNHLDPYHFKKRHGSGLRLPAGGRRIIFRGLGGLLLTAVLICLSAVAYREMCHSDFFQITNIKIEGCKQSSKAGILALSGVDIHSNLLALDTGQVRSAVEGHQWVQSATIRRIWPNQLLISIDEKKPVALISLAEGLFYLGRNGRTIAPANLPGDLDFPVISGPAARLVNDLAPDSHDQPVWQAISFIQLAGSGNYILPSHNISEINLTADGRMILFLLDRSFPIYLDGKDVKTQYARLVKILKELYRDDELAAIACIKMDYLPDSALVVRKKPAA